MNDEQKFALYLLLCIPSGYVLRFLPSSSSRSFFIPVNTYLLVTYLFPFHHGLGLWFTLCAFTYAFIKHVRATWMPQMFCAFLTVHLILRHWLRDVCQKPTDTVLQYQGVLFFNECQYLERNWVQAALGGAESNRFFSLVYMYLYVRLTSLAWDVYDDQTSKLQSGKSPSSRLTLPERESESNRLHFGAEFLAYVSFFPVLFTGWVPIEQVRKIIYQPRGHFYKPREMIVLKKTLLAIFCWIVSQYIRQNVRAQELLVPIISTSNGIRKLIILYALCLSVRMARYAVWLTAEASCVAAGLGTFASDQPTTLDEGKITNIRILRVELATSSNEFWMNWNVRTQAYMSNCVYKRLPLASRPVKVFATFLFSAVWHGMSFRYLGWGVACALLQVLFPGTRKHGDNGSERHKSSNLLAKYSTWCFKWLTTQAMITLPIIPWIFRSRDEILAVWGNFSWLYVFVLFLRLMPIGIGN